MIYHVPLVFITFISFYVYKFVIIGKYELTNYNNIIFISVIAVSVLGLGAIYPKNVKSFSILCRGLALILGFYIATNWVGFSIDDPVRRESTEFLLTHGRWLALGCSALAILRPSFLLVPTTYIIQSKAIAASATGIALTYTDYLPLIEIGILLSLGAMAIHALDRMGPRIFKTAASNEQFSAFETLVVIGIAVHFGNYFWSGVAKGVLDGGFFYWMTDNKTYYLTLIALEGGFLPISQWKGFTSGLYTFMTQHFMALNIFVLLTQIASIIIITNIRLSIILTLSYDLMHIGVFILSGIFFWKWIFLNVAIILSLRAFRAIPLPMAVKFLAVLTILFGPAIFFMARLGWYDTPSYNHLFVEAVTTDGQTYQVPSNYFLTTSVTFAQGRIGPDSVPTFGHFPVRTFGTVRTQNVKEQAERCQLPLVENDRELQQGKTKRIDTIASFIRQHHRFILSRVDQEGRLAYDLFPHHIWSNPLEYRDFERLDKRTINGYRIIIESVCLDIPQGTLQKRIIARTERYVELTDR